LQQIVAPADRANVRARNVHLQLCVRTEKADQFVGAGQLEDRVFIGLDGRGFGRLSQQFANQLFVARKKNLINPNDGSDQERAGNNPESAFQRSALPMISVR